MLRTQSKVHVLFNYEPFTLIAKHINQNHNVARILDFFFWAGWFAVVVIIIVTCYLLPLLHSLLLHLFRGLTIILLLFIIAGMNVPNSWIEQRK